MAGRPTDYTDEIIPKTEEYIAQAVPENMSVPTIEGLALLLDVHVDTIYEWAKHYPEFSDTVKKLKDAQKNHLIQTGLFGGKEINANVAIFLMKVNHNMVEKTQTDITTGGQSFNINIDGLIGLSKSTTKTTDGDQDTV